jgi:hypothetical protein
LRSMSPSRATLSSVVKCRMRIFIIFQKDDQKDDEMR